jgi:hypothetical protein
MDEQSSSVKLACVLCAHTLQHKLQQAVKRLGDQGVVVTEDVLLQAVAEQIAPLLEGCWAPNEILLVTAFLECPVGAKFIRTFVGINVEIEMALQEQATTLVK